ncbi:DUF5320 domain-containing protein [Patescibacteria group bacterium]|nr:DUF5320 domain-containing protein [Patescibacteria group bacterium]MBU2036328.1 DUF5320 domain-containing protein [Patescibacteria group bacterium]
MPRFDGTGPMGMGPRTGRGMGNCPCYMRGCFRGSISKEDKKKALVEYKAYLKEELKEVEKEIV